MTPTAVSKSYSVTLCVSSSLSLSPLSGSQLSMPSTASTSPKPAAAAASYTGAAAYDPTILNPPAVPNPPIPTQVPVQLTSTGGIPNLSIPQNGGFFGFSIEMSVSNQVCGDLSGKEQVPFLNLMANLVERVGWVQVRVGGNSQENAELVESLPNGAMLAKDTNNTSTRQICCTSWRTSQASQTPTGTLASPFLNTTPFSLDIVENGQQILGDYLLGFQAGNEPDLYGARSHGHRPPTYSPFDYFGEVGTLIQQIAHKSLDPQKGQSNHRSQRSNVLDPRKRVGYWYRIFLFKQYSQSCSRAHNASTNMASYYTNSTAFAVQNGKPFVMFETNTASCSGFPGISNSFGAALWALDWALTMAYSNFTGALFHIGGQNAYYNPFTPPPTKPSMFHQWTVGPVYYSALAMAEVLGPHNTSQVFDLTSNINTPIYAVYENGAPTKVALFQFCNRFDWRVTYTATISIGGGTTGQSNATPSQVQVKYLLADSVSAKGNFTWAGQ
ncbi:glycoside hydrolase family 79 protein, partial [Lactarius hengduanensis]